MIYVTKEVAANGDPGNPKLSRTEIWKGLVMKAENALPFVPGMAKCEVIERTAHGLVRDIVFRGEDAREKITFYPEEKVVLLGFGKQQLLHRQRGAWRRRRPASALQLRAPVGGRAIRQRQGTLNSAK